MASTLRVYEGESPSCMGEPTPMNFIGGPGGGVPPSLEVAWQVRTLYKEFTRHDTRYRVVLDTNVLVSAIIFGGKSRQVLQMAITGSVDCFLSPSMMEELGQVLHRPKFGFSRRQCLQVMEEVSGICKIIEPSVSIRVTTSDPDDDAVLECALEAKAHVVVTGDSRLLLLGVFKNIKILSPAQFLADYGF